MPLITEYYDDWEEIDQGHRLYEDIYRFNNDGHQLPLEETKYMLEKEHATHIEGCKINQDASFVKKVGRKGESLIIGIFDGHNELGS